MGEVLFGIGMVRLYDPRNIVNLLKMPDFNSLTICSYPDKMITSPFLERKYYLSYEPNNPNCFFRIPAINYLSVRLEPGEDNQDYKVLKKEKNLVPEIKNLDEEVRIWLEEKANFFSSEGFFIELNFGNSKMFLKPYEKRRYDSVALAQTLI